FSVFTAVGLFPLLCANINVVSLLEGAMEIRRLALDEDPKRNTVAMSAIATFLNSRNGKDITNTFLFGPRLESLGKWNIQLIAETLGKEGKGITPTVSIGSNDLHTTYQLYMDGPKDKFFTFVNTHKQDGGVADAIYKAVKGSFAENGLPFVELLLDDITEKELGAFMQFKMMEVLYLAKLMGVSPFGQPEVEKYKKAVG
ncbi:MAG: Glucose-6-phosphate isomerase, partial [candidate division WWE3 bacterium GW2011_GWB1_47_11]